MRHLNIALMLPSAVMSAGLAAIIRRVPDLAGSVIEISESNYVEELARVRPAILIVDPVNTAVDFEMLKSASSSPLKLIALLVQQMPKSSMRWFDDSFSVYDSLETIVATIKRNTVVNTADERGKEVSPREKEVIVGIVKGLSYKEIASEMNVSVNTVMTHRRNIAAKLHIHTPAGLTIYAIVSNLIRLEDIKSDMDRL